MSHGDWSYVPSVRLRARFRKLAICARVVSWSGQNSRGSDEHPVVTPAARNASMSASWTLPAVSSNPAESAASRLKARTRKEAVWERFAGSSGQNLNGSLAHPTVTSKTARRSMCPAHWSVGSTSSNRVLLAVTSSSPPSRTRIIHTAATSREIGSFQQKPPPSHSVPSEHAQVVKFEYVVAMRVDAFEAQLRCFPTCPLHGRGLVFFAVAGVAVDVFFAAVGVFVAVAVGVFFAAVGVFVAVAVGVFVAVAVGVFVAVAVGVFFTVAVGVFFTVAVGVFFTVAVPWLLRPWSSSSSSRGGIVVVGRVVVVVVVVITGAGSSDTIVATADVRVCTVGRTTTWPGRSRSAVPTRSSRSLVVAVVR